MKVTKEKKNNVSRSKLFGIVINPKFDEIIDWKSMSNLEMENKLKELKFPNQFVMTDILSTKKGSKYTHSIFLKIPDWA